MIGGLLIMNREQEPSTGERRDLRRKRQTKEKNLTNDNRLSFRIISYSLRSSWRTFRTWVQCWAQHSLLSFLYCFHQKHLHTSEFSKACYITCLVNVIGEGRDVVWEQEYMDLNLSLHPEWPKRESDEQKGVVIITGDEMLVNYRIH